MFDLITTFATDAIRSDFFAGGLALGAVGLAAAILRSWSGAVSALVARRALASVTLDNRTEAYRYFCLWLDHSRVLAHVRQVRMTDARWADGTTGYAPAPGRHWFVRDGRLCSMTRMLDRKARIGHSARPMETLTVTLVFGRVDTILDRVAEGRRIARRRDRVGPALHILRGNYWDRVGEVPGRRLATIVVQDDRADRVLDDMRRFYGSRDWYIDRGVPWRRGYLLHGPPGTGKSSLIRALASELSLDIATMDLGRPSLTDDELCEAMSDAPQGAILAMEDIDAVFAQRDTGDRRGGVSFSGLLNAIDGVGAQEGRALVMTTNHPERLDPALVRPGRADVHVELGTVDAAAAGAMFARFFPDAPDLVATFVAALGDGRITPAALQGWMLAHRDDPRAAAAATGLAGADLTIAAE